MTSSGNARASSSRLWSWKFLAQSVTPWYLYLQSPKQNYQQKNKQQFLKDKCFRNFACWQMPAKTLTIIKYATCHVQVICSNNFGQLPVNTALQLNLAVRGIIGLVLYYYYIIGGIIYIVIENILRWKVYSISNIAHQLSHMIQKENIKIWNSYITKMGERFHPSCEPSFSMTLAARFFRLNLALMISSLEICSIDAKTFDRSSSKVVGAECVLAIPSSLDHSQ